MGQVAVWTTQMLWPTVHWVVRSVFLALVSCMHNYEVKVATWQLQYMAGFMIIDNLPLLLCACL